MALKLSFDLMDLLNSTESAEASKRLAPFVKRDAIKREFGNRVIDEIKDRTLGGKDKNDNGFTPYSKAYKQSLEFKVFGKGSKPNLKLTGQMQASINVVGTTSTTVSIGFISKEQEDKATGHINGSGPLPVRDFWGIKKEDQVKILKSVIKDFNAREETAELFSAVSALVGGAELAVETSSTTRGASTLAATLDLLDGDDG